MGGLVGIRDRIAYCTTKFAVVGLTKSLALDHSSSGVRFNAVCPGRVETPFVQRRLIEYPDPEKACREMSATQLTGHMASPAEIASAALYLAADEQRWSLAPRSQATEVGALANKKLTRGRSNGPFTWRCRRNVNFIQRVE